GLLSSLWFRRKAQSSPMWNPFPFPSELLLLFLSVVATALAPGEAGDGAVYRPLPIHDELVDVLEQLDFVVRNLSELRQEVEELRNSLQNLAADIVSEVRSHLEETQRVSRRRRFPFPRERSDSTCSSSIYFTASSGAANTDDGESEGGYSTANAESDYDRESEKDSEEGEDEVSCETVRTARRDSLDLVNEDEAHLVLDSLLEEGLEQLLQQADRLHSGDEQEKREGFQLLLNNKLAYAGQKDFLWRLARAHSDMCELADDADEKRSYAADGKEELEIALQKWDQSAECHQWYAILCGQLSEHESIQKRIQTGYVFKEHIDKAIELKPEDPQSYYLLGRWCYQVSHLGWLEKKTASALFEAPPTATVEDALQNFLRDLLELLPGSASTDRFCPLSISQNVSLKGCLGQTFPFQTHEDNCFRLSGAPCLWLLEKNGPVETSEQLPAYLKGPTGMSERDSS
uniref:Regulator of microtubule dynamics protein 3 n=1 Tax=Amazona collaria TaxID=241587 RepID=A0A8B9GAK9_9PSIT